MRRYALFNVATPWRKLVRISSTVSLALFTILWSVTPSAAAFWDCVVPEMDGSAGISAIALLLSVGMIVFYRRSSQ